MEKYTGRTVDIIYQDRYGRFSRRRVRVIAVQDNAVRAFDLVKRAPRVFELDRILAMQPVAMPA